MRKQKWRKNWKNSRKNRYDSWRKSETKRGDRVIDGHLPSQEFGVGTKRSKIQRPSCSPRWHCKRWSRLRCSIHRARYHLRHKWRLRKWWILFQDFRDAQDKQQTQYPPAPSSKWKTHRRYWKFQSQNVQMHIFVQHDTNGQNHGPVWKTQSFLLSEICTVILWQDCYGKGSLRKSYCSTVGRRFPIGNAYSYTVKKGYSYLCLWMTSNWLERNKTLTQCGKSHERSRFGRTNIFPWQRLFGLHSTRFRNEQRYLWTITEMCLNPGFLHEQHKSYPVQEDLTHISLHGPMIRKVMHRNVWSDIAGWRLQQPSNCTKSQLHALMTINSKKKNWGLLENFLSMLSNCPQMSVFGTHW